MSLDISFNKKITMEDIKDKTPLKIEYVNNYHYITDEDNNHMLIQEKGYRDKLGNTIDSPTLDLTCYGANNPKKIMDTLINTFHAKFITDEEQERIYRDTTGLIDIEKLYDEVMERYGYSVAKENDQSTYDDLPDVFNENDIHTYCYVDEKGNVRNTIPKTAKKGGWILYDDAHKKGIVPKKYNPENDNWISGSFQNNNITQDELEEIFSAFYLLYNYDLEIGFMRARAASPEERTEKFDRLMALQKKIVLQFGLTEEEYHIALTDYNMPLSNKNEKTPFEYWLEKNFNVINLKHDDDLMNDMETELYAIFNCDYYDNDYNFENDNFQFASDIDISDDEVEQMMNLPEEK
jgi:hypothetical protein